MDPGNFATNIQAGAGYGYELLWVAPSANLVAMLFQARSTLSPRERITLRASHIMSRCL
jgi:hypothetical protein